MAQLIGGIVLGIYITSTAAVVGYCIWYEHEHPEITYHDPKLEIHGEEGNARW